jgi:predicted permease
VLGHRYWMRRFNGDPSIVGRRVLVNARPVTVVGVAPASFTGVVALVDFDAYLPFGMMSAAPTSTSTSTSTSTFREITTDRASHELSVIGRLAPGVTSGQAQAALDVLARQLERQYPDTNTSVRTRLIAEPLARPEPGDANSKPLVAGVFLLLVGLVLLVACVNVVSLLMVRATARQRELAVRAALGAARSRLVRQLLTESLLLAALGGAAGAALGWWGTTILARLPFPADIPVRFELAFDWRVFAYIAAIALGTGIVVGLLPALRASRADVNDAMREGGRGASDGRARQRLRGALVVMQVAVSVVLLVAAGLFVRSVQRAQSVDLGFDPRHILNLSVDVSQQGYDEARGRAFFKELESRVSRLPGVQSVTFASSVPLGFSGTSASIEVEGQAVPNDQRRRRPSIGYNAVGASYFETMRVPVLRGRSFSTRDDARAQPVAIVNEQMAATLWPGQDPVGKRFRVSGENEPWLEVAGVSKQGKYGFLFENPRPHFHVPIEQRYRPMRTLQIRSVGAPDAIAPIVQKTIRELDPNLPIYDVRSMTQALDGGGGFFLPRMAALFGVGLGLLGLVLALVGIYGVVSYAATLRTQEIGVRIALGAGSRDILRLVVGHGLTLVAIGITLGVSVALGVSRLIGGLLFGISPTDPATFIAVPLALAAAAFTASYIPAWRATRINPLVALQNRRHS